MIFKINKIILTLYMKRTNEKFYLVELVEFKYIKKIMSICIRKYIFLILNSTMKKEIGTFNPFFKGFLAENNINSN